MNIERCEDLIDWTSQAHARLSKCMTEGANERSDSLAKMLLVYLAQHEQQLTSTIARIKEHADPRALQTRLHDAVQRDMLGLEFDSDAYARMSVDDISREIFTIHNQIIDLYRLLENRAGLDRAGDLLGEMLQLEEHETMRLAQQVNRMHEL
ncbi:ATPase [Stutzerimonas sp. VN223-3]|uniref:ATPase n=1 Tax=Stutzerimonas sp. VN223-3 TaxID=3384601 RepID=UPI0038B45437